MVQGRHCLSCQVVLKTDVKTRPFEQDSGWPAWASLGGLLWSGTRLREGPPEMGWFNKGNELTLT